MLPTLLAQELTTSVGDFLTTEFRPATLSFQTIIEDFVKEKDNLFKGAYLSIGLPFRQGKAGKDYFPDVPLAFTPHLHQELAFERLKAPNYLSTLVATGTGSGKTECYAIPILDYCYQHRQERGVKAVLIYPMNALATDQGKRLASLIWHNPKLKGKITAGLFVGETEKKPKVMMGENHLITDKNLMRDNPPDILLTNYKMLDYLLIRPKDQQIWSRNNPETLRYLVVDEIHTFDGAQGTDLACLIRRLKARLKPPVNHLVCVGTSATLGGENAQTAMLNYAESVFGETFNSSAIIEENRLNSSEFLASAFIDPQPIPPPSKIELLKPRSYQNVRDYLKNQYQLWFNQEIEEIDPIELGNKLKSLPIVHNLLKIVEQNQVIAINQLWQELKQKMSLPEPEHNQDYPQLLLDSLIALCAFARDENRRPWVNLRLQFWLRELKRMVATVNSQPQLIHSDDLREDRKGKTLPIMHCRHCGSKGWGGLRSATGERRIACELKQFYYKFFAQDPLITYLFPSVSEPQKGWFNHLLCSDCLTLNKTDVSQCDRCGSKNLIQVIEPDQLIKNISKNGQVKRESHHDCPFCGTKDGLVILGARAASLASAAIATLFSSNYNSDRKLITFSDSVQDAAHRAGFFEARTYRNIMRTALCQYLQQIGSGQNLADLSTNFAPYWREKMKDDAQYIATFMPSDMEWLKEWEDLLNTGKINPELIELINKRLAYEVIAEMGLKSPLGGSLERTETCSITVDQTLLSQAIAQLLEVLPNEIGGLENLKPETLAQLILALVYHLRQRGGIVSDLTKSYIETGGNTFLLSKPPFMPSFGPASLTPCYLSSKVLPRFELLPVLRQKLSPNKP